MNFNTRSGLLILAGGLTAGIASTASANEMCVEYIRVRGNTVTINYDSSASSSAAHRDGGNNALCGLMFFDVEGGGSLTAFCAEFQQPIQSGATYCFMETMVANLPGTGGAMGDLKAMAVADHYYNNYGLIDTVTGDNTVANAAFQAVLWEIIEENWGGTNTSELSLELGAMQFNDLTTEVEELANQMLASLDLMNSMDIVGWANEETQDIITVTVVPGPSIALAGMIGLVGIRRRRR